MTCDNGRIPPLAFYPPDTAMLHRALTRFRRRTVPQPWVWERLATDDDRARLLAELTKTDLGRAA